MKKSVISNLHKINQIEQNQFIKLIPFLKKIKNPILTYNKLMDTSPQDIGIIFICSKDLPHPFVFQHLPLFSNFYNIILLDVPEGTKKLFEIIYNHRFTPILSILKSEEVFNELKNHFN